MTPLTKAEHLTKAQDNEAFFDALLAANLHSNCKDWATTVLFYTALHYIDALCCDLGREFTKHHERKRFIASDGRIATLYEFYRFLDDRSREARYAHLSANQTRVQGWKDSHLVPIRSFVLQNVK